MEKISIIMPVYNAEEYLERAIKSLITQSYVNIEILLIDDGSTDRSYSILLNYEELDARVRVFTQNNKGPGSAKNLGLQYASGEFIMFCDADDYYEPTMCEEMLQCITSEDVDVVMCDTFVLPGDSYQRTQKSINELYLLISGKYDLSGEDKPILNGVGWNKIFRMSIIRKYNINFYDNKCFYNGASFVYKYLLSSNNIFFLKRKLYNYILMSNSICEQFIKRSNKWYEYMLIAKNILKHAYSYQFTNKKWIYQEVNEYLSSFLQNNINKFSYKDYYFIYSFLQGITEFISDTHYDIMPFFASLVKRKVCPIVDSNPYCYVFSVNTHYAPYLGVSLQSLIEHSCDTVQYDICILYTELSENYKNKIKLFERENISIRFIDVTAYLKSIDLSILKKYNIAMESFFRFFIPNIFLNYKKICYCDCDLLFLRNIEEIFQINIGNYSLGAVNDYKYLPMKFKNNLIKTINGGLLVFNTALLEKKDLIKIVIEKTKELKNTSPTIQYILTSLFGDDFKDLSLQWNVQLNTESNEVKRKYQFFDALVYENAIATPFILHYCSNVKPWKNLSVPFYFEWWNYARKSIFYEEILINCQKIINKN